MWVYQQTGMPAHLPETAQPLPTGEAVLLPQPQKTLPPCPREINYPNEGFPRSGEAVTAGD